MSTEALRFQHLLFPGLDQGQKTLDWELLQPHHDRLLSPDFRVPMTKERTQLKILLLQIRDDQVTCLEELDEFVRYSRLEATQV